MPAGGSSNLAPMSMTGGRRSFAYHKLKKLPPAPSPPTAATLEHQDHHHPPSAAAIQESYVSYYLALGAAATRARRRRQWQRPRRVRRPRLRISGLARALRRGAAAAGARVRASVAKVARRLREGRPYIGDLFAGNYMFLQVAPSPTMVGGDKQGRFAPFTDYYYAKVGAKTSIMPPPPPATPAARALQVHHPAAAAAGVV